jgi:WD40 repeat protein
MLLASSSWGGPDQSVKLWDLATGKERLTLPGQMFAIGSTAFSPDGKLLATMSPETPLTLWDVRTGEARHELMGRIREISSLAFRPDGKLLALGSMNSAIKLWDVATGEERITLYGHPGAVEAMEFGANGKALASAGDGVRLWDVDPAHNPELRANGRAEQARPPARPDRSSRQLPR